MTEQKTCKERVQGQYESTMDDLRQLWEAYCNGEEEVEDLGSFYEYGLSFDYVAPGTFTDQERGYFRYQLSWGGPSEEFRFYVDCDLDPYKIEFWFLDWWDGAHILLTGDDFGFMEAIFDNFKDIGSVESEYQKAME